MKVLLVLTVLPILAYSTPIETIVVVDDPTELSQISEIVDDQIRYKRSGFDFAGLKQNILHSVSSASAGAVSGLSSTSGKAFSASSGNLLSTVSKLSGSSSSSASSAAGSLLGSVSKLSSSASATSSGKAGFSLIPLSLFAPIASASSGASSGKGHSISDGLAADHYGPSHDSHDSHGHSFDAGQLKKNILNTLFQAVKAISGGIVGLKGQLIKGSGYLVSAKGKLISASGDQVNGVGNNIASSAKLVPAGHGSKAELFASLSGSSSGSSSSHGHSGSGSGDILSSLTKLSGSSSSALSSSSSGHKDDGHDSGHGFTSFESHGTPVVSSHHYETPSSGGFQSHSNSFVATEQAYQPHQQYGPPSHSSNGYSAVH